MVLKVFVSLTSGNKEIKNKQQFVKQVLDCKTIGYEMVDISDPTNEEQKMFMREKAEAKPGQNVPMPPQVFSDDEYLGDYEAFLDANECDQLLEFLRLAVPKSKSEATITLSETQPEETPQETPVENQNASED